MPARSWRANRWLAAAADMPAATAYLAIMDDLRQTLNREYFLGLAEYEAHYACYEPGSFYRRHVDRHGADVEGGGSGQRVISTVCYLNEPGWPADAGGELAADARDRLIAALRAQDAEARRLETELAAARAANGTTGQDAATGAAPGVPVPSAPVQQSAPPSDPQVG